VYSEERASACRLNRLPCEIAAQDYSRATRKLEVTSRQGLPTIHPEQRESTELLCTDVPIAVPDGPDIWPATR